MRSHCSRLYCTLYCTLSMVAFMNASWMGIAFHFFWLKSKNVKPTSIKKSPFKVHSNVKWTNFTKRDKVNLFLESFIWDIKNYDFKKTYWSDIFKKYKNEKRYWGIKSKPLTAIQLYEPMAKRLESRFLGPWERVVQHVVGKGNNVISLLLPKSHTIWKKTGFRLMIRASLNLVACLEVNKHHLGIMWSRGGTRGTRGMH